MRFFGYPYNDLVICKDSPDYLVLPSGFQCLPVEIVEHSSNTGYVSVASPSSVFT